MKYILLGLAIIFEVIGSSFLQKSEGFTKVIPSIISITSLVICFILFSNAIKYIPLGFAYAIWAGLGIILTAIVSVVIFKQTLDLPAIIGILLIVSGVLVMNLFSKSTVH